MKVYKRLKSMVIRRDRRKFLDLIIYEALNVEDRLEIVVVHTSIIGSRNANHTGC